MAHDFAKDIDAVNSIRAVPTILDIVCRTTGMRFAAVARVTDERWIACTVRDNIAFGLKPGGELDVESTICHEIRQSGTAVIIDHVAEDPTFCTHHTPAKYGFQSYISMPIRLSDGTFFGTLCAIDPEPHKLRTPETINMFEMFADVIGSHLSSLEHVQETEASLLNERETSALREQFIAVLGHDLRNPLAAIDGGMRLLLKTPLNERATTVVKLVQNSAQRMAELIDNVMDFARGRLGGGLSVERRPNAALETMLRQVVAELQTSSPDHTVEAQIAIMAPVNCDPRRIGQMVSNLLGNAITYGATDKPIRIHAATSNNELELFVSNVGEPIAAATMEKIFEPFTRGAVRHSMQGLGLGLYIAHEIATAHGGKLSVASDLLETRFTFRMPLS
jgi:signal transduction histidine kinase